MPINPNNIERGAMAKALDEAYVKWFKEDGSYPFNNGFEMGYKAALNATETPNPDSGKQLRDSVELIVNAAAEWKWETTEELLEASQWVCRQLISSLTEYDSSPKPNPDSVRELVEAVVEVLNPCECEFGFCPICLQKRERAVAALAKFEAASSEEVG